MITRVPLRDCSIELNLRNSHMTVSQDSAQVGLYFQFCKGSEFSVSTVQIYVVGFSGTIAKQQNYQPFSVAHRQQPNRMLDATYHRLDNMPGLFKAFLKAKPHP